MPSIAMSRFSFSSLKTTHALAILSCLLFIGAFAQNETNQQVSIEADVVYGHKAGMALTYDILTPEEPNGAAVLFMVSGGWYSSWIQPERVIGMFQFLLDEGFTVIPVRHGSSPRFKVPEAVAERSPSSTTHSIQYRTQSNRSRSTRCVGTKCWWSSQPYAGFGGR